MRTRILAFFTATALYAGCAVAPPLNVALAQEAAPDEAAPAPEAAAPKRASKRAARKKAAPAGKAPPSGAVLILNQRDVALVELTASPKGRAGPPRVIAQAIEAGGEATAKLEKKAGCVFDLAGTFSDDSTMEAPSVNLCKERRLTLVP